MIKYVIIIMVYLAIGTASAILASAYSGGELREEVIGAIVFAWPVIGFLLVFLRVEKANKDLIAEKSK